MSDKLRDDLEGFSFDRDRLWRITGPDFVAGITDYNWEITGFAPILREACGGYGRNMYGFLSECDRRGWKYEHVEDRYV